MKQDDGDDPRNCPDMEFWGQKIAFVSPFCPLQDPGMTVPKWKCHACWEDRSKLEWAARAAAPYKEDADEGNA